MKTTAHWVGNSLCVHWYGAKEGDEAGFFRNGKFYFEGLDESFVKEYGPNMPEPEKVLADINAWQLGI